MPVLYSKEGIILQDKIFIVLEIFLIAMIPILTFGFDYFENTELYEIVFHFDKIELFINTFAVRPEYEGNSITAYERAMLDRKTDPEVFDTVWNLIKKKSSVDFPDGDPKIFYTFPIKNTPYVEMGNAKLHFIPNGALLAVGYCDKSEWAKMGLCTEFEFSGQVGDIKEWLNEEKKEIRTTINLFVGIIAIVIGLLIVKNKSGKSFLKLAGS